MKKFIMPKIVSKTPVAAVYKIRFDCGSFYIGGSTNVKQRMWNWKFKLTAGIKKNARVTAAFERTTTITFEIIEYAEDASVIKLREDFYIKQSWGSELLLNRAPGAFDSTGLKWTEDQIKRKPIYKTASKPVGKFDQGGILLKTYESRLAAAKENGVAPERIRKCLKKYGHTVNGFVYKQLNASGEYIEAPIVRRKQRKKGYAVSELAKANMKAAQQKRVSMGDYIQPGHSKPMIKYDIHGAELHRFPSIGAAAKSMGVDINNFKKLLKKGRPGYYKGFFWKPE
jgi:hypothetical protein